MLDANEITKRCKKMEKLVFAGFVKVGRHYVFGLLLTLLAIIFVFGRQITVEKLKHGSANNRGILTLIPINTQTNNYINNTAETTTATTTAGRIVLPQPLSAKDEREVVDYLRLEEQWCQDSIANRTTNVSWCPCVPSGLRGRIPINLTDDDDWAAIVESVGGDVRSGGEWSPEDCVPRTRLAVVIPCRDREGHLRVLLRHIFPVLKRQLVHFRVFVADQRSPVLFNKAATTDIAFLEATKRFDFDCVVFHDVDLLLEDDRALMRCGPTPRHYARALDKFRYGGYRSFGGVVSITPEMFRRVNGYPLKYFGWGGEDDDMWNRVRRLWSIYRMPSVVGRYTAIPHAADPANRKNPKRVALMRLGFKQNEMKQFDGLTDVVYNINAVDLRPLFTRIEADINTTNILKYPQLQQQQLLQQPPQQTTFVYRRAVGICEDPDVILASISVSWTSCRFHCDNFVAKRCFGFSYSDRGGRCTLIRAVCSLVALPGWTYVKQ